MAEFLAGQPVIWWNRDGAKFVPVRAKVRAVTKRRVGIEVETSGGGAIRYVSTERLQEIRSYYYIAPNQPPSAGPPMESWGAFCRYCEIAEDLYASRQVDIFDNGNCLSYDRQHWTDSFGMLGDLRFCRVDWERVWGPMIEITKAIFEQAWRDAQGSTLRDLQRRDSSRMSEMGATPPWLRR